MFHCVVFNANKGLHWCKLLVNLALSVFNDMLAKSDKGFLLDLDECIANFNKEKKLSSN